ncbi:MAG: 50S ribosomal protein L31e [Candidatus Aenigmarchaeota archaeon ex4484_56]|nr:MAG: 50S ribosomal protein L31e [Candidatus Aenigmarchaeota archaeon ex4484_56]
MSEEKIYIIPLRKAKRKPRSRRANAAIKIIREYLQRHTKTENIKIENNVNEYVWERGMHKIPRKVKVKTLKKKDGVYAELFK